MAESKSAALPLGYAPFRGAPPQACAQRSDRVCSRGGPYWHGPRRSISRRDIRGIQMPPLVARLKARRRRPAPAGYRAGCRVGNVARLDAQPALVEPRPVVAVFNAILPRPRAFRPGSGFPPVACTAAESNGVTVEEEHLQRNIFASVSACTWCILPPEKTRISLQE
jgi:hypothetical protein